MNSKKKVKTEREPLTSLSEIVSRALSRLSMRTLILSAFILLLAIVGLSMFVIRPAYKKFEGLRQDTEKALSLRNQALVRSSVEQAASNITRLLGDAEHAVETLASSFAVENQKLDSSSIIPLEEEFYPGGRLTGTLVEHKGYAELVTFDSPQIKLGDAEEIKVLKRYIK